MNEFIKKKRLINRLTLNIKKEKFDFDFTKNNNEIIVKKKIKENRKFVVNDTFKNKIFNKFKNIIKLKIAFLNGFMLFFFEKFIIVSFLFLKIDE